MKNRDEFKTSIKRKIAEKVGYMCSNPSCHRLTISSANGKTVNIGVASHICAAAKGGPRYDKKMTEEERRAESNGIWLCQTCSCLIDKEPQTYTVNTLKKWKKEMEELVYFNFNKPIILDRPNKLDYVFDLLKDQNKWAKIEDIDYGFYFIGNPAYTITVVMEEEYITEYYSYLQTNHKTKLGELFIKFNEICIYKAPVLQLDSSRCLTVMPESGFVKLNANYNYPLQYKYFIKDSKRLILRNFIRFKVSVNKGEYEYALARFDEIVTFFDSIDDQEEFDWHYHEEMPEENLKEYLNNIPSYGENELEFKYNRYHIAVGRFAKKEYASVVGHE